MAERLTHKNNFLGNYIKKVNEIGDQLIDTMIFNDNTDWRLGNAHTIYYGNAVDKLAQLEDIMDKYGIESVEELEKELSISRLLHQTIAELSKMVTKAENERDTWQKACELACKWFKQTGFIGDQTKVDYFYQQAKKESEQK